MNDDDYDDGLSGPRVLTVGCFAAIVIAAIVYTLIRIVYNQGQ